MAIRAALGARGTLLRRQLLAENLVLSIVGGVLGSDWRSPGSICSPDTRRFTNRTGEIALDGWVLTFTLVCRSRSPWSSRGRRGSASSTIRSARWPAAAERHRQHRPAPHATRAGREPARRLVHAADRRRTPDPQPAPALRGRSRIRPRQRPQPAGARFQRLQSRAPAAVLATCSIASRRGDGAVSGDGVGGAAGGLVPAAAGIPGRRRGSRGGRTAPKTVTRVVSPGYFETVGTRLKAGRGFQPSDNATAPPVVILSESMARYCYFKDQNAIGRRISWKLFNGNWSPKAKSSASPPTPAPTGSSRRRFTPCISPTRRPTRSPRCSCARPRRIGLPRAWWRRFAAWIPTADRPCQTLEEIRDETIAPQRLNAT